MLYIYCRRPYPGSWNPCTWSELNRARKQGKEHKKEKDVEKPSEGLTRSQNWEPPAKLSASSGAFVLRRKCLEVNKSMYLLHSGCPPVRMYLENTRVWPAYSSFKGLPVTSLVYFRTPHTIQVSYRLYCLYCSYYEHEMSTSLLPYVNQILIDSSQISTPRGVPSVALAFYTRKVV